MGYLRHSVHSVTWVGILRGFTRAVSFLRIAILARLLSPTQIGLFGIASIVLAFVEVLMETGINVFLVQKKEDIKEFINTAWIISIVRGILICCIIIIAAPLVSSFFNSPNAYSLLLLVGIVPLVRGFINPSIVIFQKELQFKKEFYFKGSIFLIESIFSVLLVYVTKSPAGIIFGLIIGAFFEVVLSFLVVSPRPRFRFVKTQSLEIIHKGKWTTASGVFNYLYHNLDDVVVGKMINVGALGMYDMAYRISTLPISEVADVVSRVAFPVYSKISGDKERLKKAFIKTIGLVSLLAIPLGGILIIFPKEIILIVLGEKWISAAPTLQVLGFFGIIRSISGTTSALFLSVHKQKYVATVTFVSFLTLVVTIIPLISMFGMLGAAYSVVLGSVASIPFMVYYSLKIFKQ